MFYFWIILTRHKAPINTKTHKHKTTISKKVVKTLFKSYHIMIIIIFLTFILSGLFFIRITRRGKSQGQREKKTWKGNKKRPKKHRKRTIKQIITRKRSKRSKQALAYEACNRMRMPLHTPLYTPKTLETC